MRDCNMVEHSIKHHGDSAFSALRDQIIEVVLITQATIDLEMVQRVIPMRDGFEDWAKEQSVAPQIHNVIKPRDEAREAVRGIVTGTYPNGRAARTERKDLPPQRVIDEAHVLLHSEGWSWTQRYIRHPPPTVL